MEKPTLSICIPASEGCIPLLNNTLASLDSQTSKDFEVVIGWDDEHGAFPIHELRTVGFHLSWAWSGRRGSLPHRNHARNAAASVARGAYLWFLDADFLLDEWAVAHMVQHLRKNIALTPCLVGLGEHGQPVADQWSGFASDYRRGEHGYKDVGPIPEGFPALHAEVFHALGRFDEQFVGWGGNKEEFVSRLHRVDDLVPYRLLHGVRGYHQHHPPNKGDPAIVKSNQAYHQELKRQMDEGRDWWLDVLDDVLEVLM